MVKTGQDVIDFIENNNLTNENYVEIFKRIRKNNKPTTKYNRENKNKIIIHDNYAVVNIFDKNINDIRSVLIDIEDIEKIKKHTWGLSNGNRYPIAAINKKRIPMHRFILGYEGELDVDHINKNRYDNRKENLRIVTRAENLSNNNAIGVYKNGKKWIATIMRYGKTYRLGSFNTIEEAKQARKEKEIEIEKNKEKNIEEFIEFTKHNETGIRKTEDNRWTTSVWFKNKNIYLGTFGTKEDAKAAKEQFFKDQTT